MKAVVTGHVGLVGRHMTRRLETDGWDVTGIDIADGTDARDFFRTDEAHYDLAVHCAAHVGGRADIDGRPTYVGAVNLQLDGALFEWALRTRPRRVVYYSSSAAYPVDLQTRRHHRPLTEADIYLLEPRQPDATYGLVKVTGERLAAEAEAEGLRVHVFRPFSGYAADQALDYPFPAFIDRARRHADPFQVWGDGAQVRDFIHIDDVTAATMAAVIEDIPGPVNLGTGQPTTFNQLACLAAERAGYSPRLEHLPAAPTGVDFRVCDPAKLLTFYTPKVSLEEGVWRALRS